MKHCQNPSIIYGSSLVLQQQKISNLEDWVDVYSLICNILMIPPKKLP